MDGLGGYYAKWNKSDRERQILYDITQMKTKKKQTHRYREQTCGCHWGDGRGEAQYRVGDLKKGYYGII